MRIYQKQLVEAFQGHGDAFESFMNDLVRAVGRSCGIDSTHIHWDLRTNLADGGRDIIIDIPNPRGGGQFIPPRPSVWSLKSGKEGIDPASLSKEVLADNRPKLKEALKQGCAYVWVAVHPAQTDVREKMKEAADKVASTLNVDPGQFEFRWVDHLEAEANLNPGVISVHFPQINRLFSNVLFLREWERKPGFGEEWVGFGGREDVIGRITRHLLDRGTPNTLHIAGLSGIGKTRTAFEACKREPELNGVLYIERLDHLTHELCRYLEEAGRRTYLVIDETPLHELQSVEGRLSGSPDIRVVTISPARRQPSVSAGQVIVLPEPDTTSGVFEVVRVAGAGLPDGVLQSIAAQAGHDLRLALLLVQASKKLPKFHGMPVVDIDSVWDRVMSLYQKHIGDTNVFRERYEVLTASVDVGRADDVAGELVALATFFHQPVEHVHAAADLAIDCGLGICTRRFFEATPRALATRLFEDRVWRRIRDRLDDFVGTILTESDRLARRFLERCQDCSSPVREEVMDRLADFFLRALSDGDVTVLAPRERSRLFQTWAEFDPQRGLAWLRRAVEHATSEQLRTLDGDPDGSGGWRGRRQLVWLCEHMACFAEHFENCEVILFQLATEETEPSIGNNSTAIWQSLFLPAPCNTEVPFDRRLPILLHRLRQAENNNISLIMGAAVGCPGSRHLLVSPPQVVGGRVVPPPWRPGSWDELASLRREAGHQIIDTIGNLPKEQKIAALRFIVEQLGTFIRADLLADLQKLLSSDNMDDSIRRQTVAELEQEIGFLRLADQNDWTVRTLGPLEEWLKAASSSTLEGRVRDLTAQDYWAHPISGDRESRYECLADELIASPEILRGLATWFASPECRSADSLGAAVGRRDSNGQIAPVIRDWLLGACCPNVTIGYLTGAACRSGDLRPEWVIILDDLAASHPEMAATATISADVSRQGFERVIGLLTSLPPPSSRFLRPFAFGPWLQVLGSKERVRTVQLLIQLADNGESDAPIVGADLVTMWAHVDPTAIDETFAPLALTLLDRTLSVHRGHSLWTWLEALRLFCPFRPKRVAEIIITRLEGLRMADEETLRVLGVAAERDPSGVMDAVGSIVLDPERSVLFRVASFQSLFEKIRLQDVSAWLDRHGTEHLPQLARHFQSPWLADDGRVVLPSLTEWLFREHEADDSAFRSFLMGRHVGMVWTSGQTDPHQKQKEMGPFLVHELRRVREWAEYEVQDVGRMDQHFREIDEEYRRR